MENNDCQILQGLWSILPDPPVQRSEMYTGEYKEVEFSMVEGQPPSNGIKMRSHFKCTGIMQRGAVVEFEEIRPNHKKNSTAK